MPKDKQTPEEEIMAEALRPRPVFLVAGGVFSGLTVLTYLYEDTILAMNEGDGAIAYAVLLILLVSLSILMVLFYRNPRLGNRLLGYDVVMQDMTKEKKSGYHFSAGFKTETGAETKRLNSRRKQGRYARKHMAKVTREMQAEKRLAEERQVQKDADAQDKTPGKGEE